MNLILYDGAITGSMRTTPTSALDILTCLPSLDLVVQGKVRAAVHQLWSLGCWSYLHSNNSHTTIVKWLQKLDPLFSMGNDIMVPAYKFEPK
jgi:hypothetical protein